MKTKQKQEGQFMTPKPIVDMVLDAVGYDGSLILNKKVCEPSFGTGAFLIRIASRIVSEGRAAGLSDDALSTLLENSIYGFEKDKELYQKGIERLNQQVKVLGIPQPEWTNLICGDTLLLYKKLVGRMDFVLGNPPFVIVHNIPLERRDIVKDFHFTEGTLNIYTAFFELGYSLLNETGKLGFISPNSYLKLKSLEAFRRSLRESSSLSVVWDFKDSRIFPTAEICSCITVLCKQKVNTINYREYAGLELMKEMYVPRSDLTDTAWNFCDKHSTEFLKSVKAKSKKLKDIAYAQNAIATLRDSLFVHDMFRDAECQKPFYGGVEPEKSTVFFKEDNIVFEIEKSILCHCVKASSYNNTIENSFILFPYVLKDGKYIAITEDCFEQLTPLAFQYLNSHKVDLLLRKSDNSAAWYEFGRRQGLEQYGKPKAVVKNVFKKNTDSLKCYPLYSTTIAYSGIVITASSEKKLQEACNIISSPEFARYAKLVGKDMSGGYLSISSKNIQEYGIE